MIKKFTIDNIDIENLTKIIDTNNKKIQETFDTIAAERNALINEKVLWIKQLEKIKEIIEILLGTCEPASQSHRGEQ
jgi:hypothetical protein